MYVFGNLSFLTDQTLLPTVSSKNVQWGHNPSGSEMIRSIPSSLILQILKISWVVSVSSQYQKI